MSETKHTPGPWDPQPDFGGTVWAGQGRKRECIAEVSGNTHERTWANAQLIAAAPELYEALTSCLRDLESWVHDQLDGTRMFDEVWQTMEPYRAAIKKAQGR